MKLSAALEYEKLRDENSRNIMYFKQRREILPLI
jgi:hypothetical protein